MANDDKKPKTIPAPKNEVPPKNKSTSSVDTSKAEGGKAINATDSTAPGVCPLAPVS